MQIQKNYFDSKGQKLMTFALGHLRFDGALDLDSLKYSMMGFSFVCAIISLMILQLIFTIPQLIAKLLNYSETDYGTGGALSKTDNNLVNRMGPPGSGGGQNGGGFNNAPRSNDLKNSFENKIKESNHE